MVKPRYFNSLTHSLIFPAKFKSGKTGMGREANIMSLLLGEFGTSILIFK